MTWNLRSAFLRLRSFAPRLALMLAVALCVSCGGDDDDRGPTAPQEFAIAFTGAITNLDCTCLHDFEVLFDGQVVTTVRSTNATRSQVWTMSKLAPRGQHQVAIRVARQTSTSSEYFLLGNVDVFNTTGGTVADIELQDRLTTLRQGESVSWSFTF